MSRFLIAAIADLGHRELTLESAPHPIVNTLWLPPCLLDTLVAIRLVTLEWLGTFFYNWRLDSHGDLYEKILQRLEEMSSVDVRERAMSRTLPYWGSKHVSTISWPQK